MRESSWYYSLSMKCLRTTKNIILMISLTILMIDLFRGSIIPHLGNASCKRTSNLVLFFLCLVGTNVTLSLSLNEKRKTEINWKVSVFSFCPLSFLSET